MSSKKYRYPVLAGEVSHGCRELLREIARSKEMMILARLINRDHVHLVIVIPQQMSVSKAV
nr:transposase [Sedimenticola selenatireducens]